MRSNVVEQLLLARRSMSGNSRHVSAGEAHHRIAGRHRLAVLMRIAGTGGLDLETKVRDHLHNVLVGEIFATAL
jgi:hypothetical protein